MLVQATTGSMEQNASKKRRTIIARPKSNQSLIEEEDSMGLRPKGVIMVWLIGMVWTKNERTEFFSVGQTYEDLNSNNKAFWINLNIQHCKFEKSNQNCAIVSTQQCSGITFSIVLWALESISVMIHIDILKCLDLNSDSVQTHFRLNSDSIQIQFSFINWHFI